MVYITINKDFLNKTKKEAEDKAIKEFGAEDGSNLFYYDVNDSDTRIDEITEDGKINVVNESPFGYISFNIKLEDEDYITLAGLIIKKLNKFKSVVESLK